VIFFRHLAEPQSSIELMAVVHDVLVVFEHWLDEKSLAWVMTGVFSVLNEIRMGNQSVLTLNGHDCDGKRTVMPTRDHSDPE